MTNNKILIIGISGVTCGGKTTLACKLNKLLPNSKLISQDDYFLDVDDPRHTWLPELNHVNYDIIGSLDMEKMERDIRDLIKDKCSIQVEMNDKKQIFQNNLIRPEDLEKSIYEKLRHSNLQILIVEGFCIFNYKPLRDLFHLKYYFTLTKEQCYQRRIQRVYEPPDCPGYFDKCAWPEHLKQLEEVKKEMEGVTYFDGTSNCVLRKVLNDINLFIDVNRT